MSVLPTRKVLSGRIKKGGRPSNASHAADQRVSRSLTKQPRVRSAKPLLSHPPQLLSHCILSHATRFGDRCRPLLNHLSRTHRFLVNQPNATPRSPSPRAVRMGVADGARSTGQHPACVADHAGPRKTALHPELGARLSCISCKRQPLPTQRRELRVWVRGSSFEDGGSGGLMGAARGVALGL